MIEPNIDGYGPSPEDERQYKEHSGYASKAISLTLPAPSPNLMPLMVKYMAYRNLTMITAKLNGWYVSTEAGDIWPRIVIPAISSNADNRYWQARLIETPDTRYGAATPRWQSPNNAREDSIITVWAADTEVNRRMVDFAVVCEGPMDAIAAADHGYTGVALMGCVPSDKVIELTAKMLHDKKVLVVADSDAQEEWANVLGRLRALNVQCRLVTTNPYKDLCEMPCYERKLRLFHYTRMMIT